MSDPNQTIQSQLDNFNANTAHATMSLVGFGTLLANMLKPLTDSVAQTVTTNVLVMTVPARVISVEATTGDVTGIFMVGGAGATLATKQVAVAYDVNGTATITFKASDNVSAAKVTYWEFPYPANPNNTSGLGNLLAWSPT